MASALAKTSLLHADNRLDHRIAGVPGLRRLGHRGLVSLSPVFARHRSPDPYARSPAHTALTARRGLWRHRCGLLVGLHPNLDDSIIIFPPPTAAAEAELPELAASLSDTGSDIRVIRIPTADAPRLADRFNGSSDPLQAEVMREDVLDWAFPVHVLATDTLAEPSGGDFRDLRKKLGRAERAGLVTEPLDLNRHRAALLRLSDSWAREHEGGPDDAASPLLYTLALVRAGHFDLDGFVVRLGQRLVGFQVWEAPLPGCTTANGLVGIGDTAITGLSEFMEVEKARILRGQGIGEICVGGSETPGLDAFKRKLRPSRSIELRTLKIG